MYTKAFGCLVAGLMLISCSEVRPRISVVCEEDDSGNSIIKWETMPALQGEVKAYASTRPEDIPEHVLVASANIADQKMTIVTNNPSLRYYYTLLFNDKYRVRVAPRNVVIPGIQNFRDLGGYPSYAVRKRLRWGMLYRSAAIDNPSRYAVQEMKNLGVKTIVDLRSDREQQKQGVWVKNFHIVHSPILAGSIENTLEYIENGEIKSDTVYRIVERVSRELITKYSDEYRKVFDVLLDAGNYPVVIQCSSGNERTGIMAALVLSALGVNQDIILDDYLLSNYYFNIPSASSYAYQLPVQSQEAITSMLSARENYLNASLQVIKSRYGDVASYLSEGIGLDKKEIKNLQKILLVPLE